jgi:hypothetical protein
MGQCCYCCLSNDDKIDRLFEKIEKCTEISKLEPGSRRPTLLAGNVELMYTFLTAPVTKKQCVYYKVRCEREIKKYRRVERDDGSVSYEEYYVWEHVYTDEQKCDFKFVDPQSPTICVVVPIGTTAIEVHSVQDGYSESFNMNGNNVVLPIMMGFTVTLPNGNYGSHEDHPTGRMRYFESSFHIGEKLAVIGAIEEFQFTQPDGSIEIGKKIAAMPETLVTDEYCEKNGWDDWDRRAWKDLVKQPVIILTDLAKHTMREGM